MSGKRARRFVYVIDNADNDIIEYFQMIDCEYHIYGYKDDMVHGFILFKYTKSDNAVEKLLHNPVSKAVEESITIIERIKNMEGVWQIGNKPKRVKSIKGIRNIHERVVMQANQSEELMCKFVMNQNDKLLKSVIEDKLQTRMENVSLVQQNVALLQQNAELQKTILQQSVFVNTMSNSHNSTDNSKNKKITNVNVFLNTECKDAITMSDFISNLKIKDEDLMCMREHGYVESVSKLLNRALTEYDLYKRPIHCTDTKRDVLHVKDQEGWKKETHAGESDNIDKAFRHISHMHRKKMTNYYKDVEVNTKEFDEKASMMYKIASAGGTEEESFKKKIIKNIVENVRI